MGFNVTCLYSGILAVVYIFLSARVIIYRRSLKVVYGDGGHNMLIKAIRAHSNFAEYVPFALLLMALAEGDGAISASFLHFYGTALVIARFMHLYTIAFKGTPFIYRVLGTAGSTSVILFLGATLIFHGRGLF